jgi:hypothetical protein
MSIFNQMIRGSQGLDGPYPTSGKCETSSIMQLRTFRETIQDQINYHLAKVDDLNAVRDSLTPEVERFVEAIQKLG